MTKELTHADWYAKCNLVEALQDQVYALKAKSEALTAMVKPVPVGMCLVPIEPTFEMIAALFWDGNLDMMLGHAAIAKEGFTHYRNMLLTVGASSPVAIKKAH